MTSLQLETRRAAFVADNHAAAEVARAALTRLGEDAAAIRRALLRAVVADEKKAAAADARLHSRLRMRQTYELAVRVAFVWAALATLFLVAKLWWDSRARSSGAGGK